MLDHTVSPSDARIGRGVSRFALGALLLCLALPARAEPPVLRVEATGRIAAPFDRVRATLLDLDAFAGWFPALAEWRVLSRRDGEALVYGRQALPWPVRDRDYIVRYRWWTDPDGIFHLEATSQPDAEVAPSEAAVRLERLRSEWLLEDAGDATDARYVYEGSAAGTLPGWVARIGWRRHTGIVIDALAVEVERRRHLAP